MAGTPAIGQQAVGQLPWGHITVLLDKLDDKATRDWYAEHAAAHGWSRNVLLNQIMNKTQQRVGAAPSNFAGQLAPADSDLAGQLAKDPYVFDFLGLTGKVAEHNREQALPPWACSFFRRAPRSAHTNLLDRERSSPR
jgi:predicted nuclease of restriction endonuclease-like (RecB) superfamily